MFTARYKLHLYTQFGLIIVFKRLKNSKVFATLGKRMFLGSHSCVGL